MKTELTIEQTANLIELGVSEEKASSIVRKDVVCNGQEYVDFVRVFTLTDLLQILPKEKSFADAEAFLNIHFDIARDKWYAQYLDFDHDDDVMAEERATELVDALYELLLWVIEHKYIEL